tara:strand:+ start:1984 stop:2769 length:786 start_codon:yes stop_codon:yes gene_type:complete
MELVMKKDLVSLIKQFMPFAKKHIGFDYPPKLFLKQDHENAKNALGKTAFYDREGESVTLYITGRHPKDVLRSLGHELVHHKQNCDGKFNNAGYAGKGYAQKNPLLRGLESEANEWGSMCVRDFTDLLEENNTIYYKYLQKGVKDNMSIKDWKNNEIKTLLAEAWGFKMDLNKFTEAKKVISEGQDVSEEKEKTPQAKTEVVEEKQEKHDDDCDCKVCKENLEEASKTGNRLAGRVSNGDRRKKPQREGKIVIRKKSKRTK